ncbi:MULTISPECIES: alpha/beta fold hydrolase [unclassified Nocardiopsis]|uniref:alpha/beta fold hydrolase n=1 Tax=unclassified Nocardiopsis TaxID=2649073 RepID=UPI00135A266B|nr:MULTISPECIES: alpha/beta hydrolase [unclassified Nocardiopsis]
MEPEQGTDQLTRGSMAWWRVRGQGPPLVCVHGAGVSSRQTLPLIRKLAGRSEAWAVDLPGFGAATAPDHAPTVPGLAEALLEWLRQRWIARPCLLGVSMGAQVTAEAAVRAPDEVGSLVLVGPTVDPRGRSLPVLAERLLRDNFREGLSVAASCLVDYRDAGPRRVVRSWLASRDHRIDRILPRARQPALVLRGQRDPLCPKPWAEEATRLLPRGRLVTLPGQPHALTAAAPGRVADLVHDFAKGAVL